VLARDEKTGAFAFKTVLRHLYSQYDDTVTVRVVPQGGSSTEAIIVSRPHTFFVDGRGWVAAEDLHAGDQIVTGVWDGQGDRPQLVAWRGPGPVPVHAGRAIVARISIEHKPLSAHNLTVDGFHTYLVGESGLWVHNWPCGNILEDGARGVASEVRVLKDLGLSKNSTLVSTAEGNAIPDSLTSALSVEIKDRAYVTATKQLRVQTGAASEAGLESTLVTGTNTVISGPAQKLFDTIIRRDDLGPR
jgi:Pretoxin HINT domain